jgi:hypothetical protein
MNGKPVAAASDAGSECAIIKTVFSIDYVLS